MTGYDSGFIGRVLVFTLTYGLMGAIFPLQQGTPTITYLLGVLITGFLYALLLSSVLTQMSTRRKERVLSVWIPVYVIQFINPLIEGYFFTNLFGDITLLAGGIFFGAILAFVYAVIAGLLFTPKKATNSLFDELKNYFHEKKVSSWIWRVIVAVLSWPLLYFIFGTIVAPIVMPYYNDPTLGYNLVTPSLEILISVQIFRGLIYVGSLLPIIASLKVDTKNLFFTIFGFLYLGGGLAIFMIVETFPLMLKIAHGLGDLLATSCIFSLVIVYLLRKKKT